MALRHSGDDVFRAKGRIAAKEHVRQARLKGVGAQDRQAPAVKVNTALRLNPGERVFLAHGDQHRVAGQNHFWRTGGYQAAPALGVVHCLHDVKSHAGEHTGFMDEARGHMEIEDGNALVHGVLFFPGRGLHLVKTAANYDFDIAAAQPPCRPAAVHGGVAAAQDQYPASHLGHVAKGHGRQPIDADMDVAGRLAASRNLQVATAWRAAAHKHGVVALAQQGLHGVDALATLKVDPHVQDVTSLLVDHRFRQAKAGYLRADKAARLGFAVKHGHLVA